MRKGRGLEEIMYFDDDGIIKLVNQIENARLEKQTEERVSSGSTSGEVEPKFSLGPLISWLGGIGADVGAKAALKREKSVKRTEELVHTREQRYLKLLNYLEKHVSLGTNLDDAWLKSLERGSTFCYLEADFEPIVGGGNNIDWIDIANSSKFLQIKDTQTGNFKIGMSFNKISEIRDETIRYSSHLAIRMRNGASLIVLGKMDRTKYIKPFVVSWR